MADDGWVVWLKDRILSFVLEGEEIVRYEFLICPHCQGIIDHDFPDPNEHIGICSGDLQA